MFWHLFQSNFCIEYPLKYISTLINYISSNSAQIKYIYTCIHIYSHKSKCWVSWNWYIIRLHICCFQICFHWLKQCFWNYLDWNEICQYVCLCVVMGIDYQVYLCCAILKHQQKNIMEHMQTQDLIIHLKVRF